MTPTRPVPEVTLSRRGTVGPCPPSFAQERLWFIDQLEPRNPLYNIARSVHLIGPLDLGALQAALDAIVVRHEAVRTTLPSVDGRPVQLIAPPGPVTLERVELNGNGAPPDPEAIQRLLVEEARRPFDLSRDLMLRATVFRLHAEQHILLLMTHHIASDGWSMGILVRELTEYYTACVSGRRPTLPDLPIQYADYAQWQREWLRGPVLERALTYWTGHLAGLAPLELPTDRPRPSRQSYRGAREAFRIPGEITSALKVLSRQARVTLFMTLVAAFQALLHRYSGRDDIAVGTPIAGRGYTQLEGLIGFFVNTLVLRSDLSGNPTFRQLLTRVQEVALRAYEHQDLPFEKLVAELQPTRTLSHTPLFQVMLAFDSTPPASLVFPGLTAQTIEIGTGTAKCDLILSVKDTVHGLVGSMEYSTDLWDPATIRRMLGHFETLLAGIAADPGQTLSALPLLTASERRQLVVEWNDTRRDYPADRVIPELFEAQVVETPDRIALAFEDQSLTYDELNRRANQLAHHLRALGVRPEVPVALCVERSPEMIVGLLGILKAGGAYVPLDPTYPRQRLAFILEDTRAPVVVTQERLRATLPEHGPRILCLDRSWAAIAQEDVSNPKTEVREQNLAYVIYTSGTTGNPKGVMIDHKSLVNYLCWFNESPLARKLQSLPAITKPTFDASLKQLIAPLLRGAPVWLLPEEVVSQPGALLKTLATRAGVGLNCVPSLWNALLDAIDSDEQCAPPATLSFLFLGGEPLNRQLIDRTFAAFRGIEIWNLYGPTEATANATVGRIFRDGAITLGRPIANTQIFILDSRLQPVPIGVSGELYIGGIGLARGYLNSPEITAEKFVPDPFSDDPGARLYKTGDLVRYLPDGNIQFLGRVDYQVKIRGFRVEPGEIEAVLRQHPTVKDVVVVAREDGPGDRSLVAYFTARGEPGAAPDQLRQYLGERLPAHMIPAGFVRLPALPLTPNGKVDRRALLAAKQTSLEVDRAFVAPRTPLEDALAKIWADVLGIERVGVEDNFFDLGGHSLLTMRLCDQIEKTFGKRLPLATLFQAPTVEHLAGILGQEGWPTPFSSLVALQLNGSKPPFFWVHGETSNAFLPRYLPPDQPLYGLLQQSREGQRALYTRMEDIAAHYLSELRRAQPHGPYFLGGYCIGGTLAFEIAQQLRRQGQEVALLVLLDPASPGDGESSLSFTSHASHSLPDASSFGDRVSRHWRTLARLGPQAKLAYIWDGVSSNLRGQLTKITDTAKEVACTIYSVTGTAYPLPPSLRIPYIEAVHRRARRGYVPQVYPGRVVVFTTEGGPRDPRSVWGRLAAGGLELSEVPGRHTEIVFDELHVRGLAEQLKTCLARAQAAACSRDRPAGR